MFTVLSAALAVMLLASPIASETGRRATCASSDLPARIVRFVTPETPGIARQNDLTGTSLIRVDLSETGSLRAASVALSSGIDILDRAALQTAKSMIYAPEIRSCAARGGSYVLRVEFLD